MGQVRSHKIEFPAIIIRKVFGNVVLLQVKLKVKVENQIVEINKPENQDEDALQERF